MMEGLYLISKTQENISNIFYAHEPNNNASKKIRERIVQMQKKLLPFAPRVWNNETQTKKIRNIRIAKNRNGEMRIRSLRFRGADLH